MNARERAAQIWCTPYMASTEMDVKLCELIAAQIREAEREAVKEREPSRELPSCGHDGDCSCYRDKLFAEGFRAARDKAAGIAEKEYQDHASAKNINSELMMLRIRDAIHAMEADKD